MKITPDNIDYYHSLIFGEVGVKKQKSAKKKIDVIATRGTPKISRSAVTSLFSLILSIFGLARRT